MGYLTAKHFANLCDARIFSMLKEAPKHTPRHDIYLAVAGERDAIIANLCENDRNGCYSDEDHIAEFGEPSKLSNLLEILLDIDTRLDNLRHYKTLKALKEAYARFGQGKSDAIDMALDFVLDCAIALGGGYHPDTEFADYLRRDRAADETPTPTFEPKVAKVLQSMHHECHKTLEMHDIDICEVGLIAMQALERLRYCHTIAP